MIEHDNSYDEFFANFEKNGSLREGWEKANEEGKLYGCGLVDNLTLNKIEEIRDMIEFGVNDWIRLAGVKYTTTQERLLNSKIEEMKGMISSLQKELNSVKNRMKDEKDWSSLIETIGN